MIVNYDAFAWGVKGARAGLGLSENLYSHPGARSAWIAGHKEEIARGLFRITSLPPCARSQNNDAGSRNRSIR